MSEVVQVQANLTEIINDYLESRLGTSIDTVDNMLSYLTEAEEDHYYGALEQLDQAETLILEASQTLIALNESEE